MDKNVHRYGQKRLSLWTKCSALREKCSALWADRLNEIQDSHSYCGICTMKFTMTFHQKSVIEFLCITVEHHVLISLIFTPLKDVLLLFRNDASLPQFVAII